MTYLALARLTVGAEPRQHKRELQEGLERVIEEMAERGMTPAEIEAAFEEACTACEVDL